jgi:hypothetical protein
MILNPYRNPRSILQEPTLSFVKASTPGSMEIDSSHDESTRSVGNNGRHMLKTKVNDVATNEQKQQIQLARRVHLIYDESNKRNGRDEFTTLKKPTDSANSSPMSAITPWSSMLSAELLSP